MCSERDQQLISALRAATSALMDRRSIRDMDVLLSQIVVAAVETVPGADAGGISTTDEGQVGSRNPSTAVITKLDRLQSELREGPCITAIEEDLPDGLVVVDDLAGDDGKRWPQFAPHAVEHGYRAMVSIQLQRQSRHRAALNLYARTPAVFDADARLTAALFGVQAATLLFGAEQAGQLQRAVDSHDLIGQAKGMLMERFTADGDAAFQMLVTSSHETNMKLLDVAGWLVSEAEERRRQRGRSPRGL